jgi:hypothetical protein
MIEALVILFLLTAVFLKKYKININLSSSKIPETATESTVGADDD